MNHSSSLAEIMWGVGSAHIELRWFLYGREGFDTEDPSTAPLPAKDIDSRIERLEVLEHGMQHLYDAMAAANRISDEMEPRSFQSIQVTIGKSLRRLERIPKNTDYTDAAKFIQLQLHVQSILLEHHSALLEALDTLELLCGLGGLDLQALLDGGTDQCKSTLVEGEKVERIAYDFDTESARLNIVLYCAGRAPISHSFPPKVRDKKEVMTDQAKLLLCVLANKGQAKAAQLVRAIYPDARTNGSLPRNALRGFATQCREINKSLGVELVKFSRSGYDGNARTASRSIEDLGEIRENSLTRAGTKSSRFVPNPSNYTSYGEEEEE